MPNFWKGFVMEENQRLSERMMDSNVPYGPKDPGWDQFVRDHKEWIKSQCTLKKFKPEELLQYRFMPAEFYVANEGVFTATWIFMLINGIASPMEFNESRTQWYLPPPSLIPELYSQYISCSRTADME